MRALTNLSNAKKIDLNRVLVLRTASDYDQPPAGETVDQRPGEEPDHDRRQERDDEEQAHPPRRMGPTGQVGGEGDRRHPRAEAGAKRRHEEQTERSRAPQERELTTKGRRHALPTVSDLCRE